MSIRPTGETFDDNPTAPSLPYEQMRTMFAYWQTARGDRPMPTLDAIDPVRLPRDCLVHIGVMDVSHDPLRFRSRLVGTAVADAIGVDHTGQYADEIPGMAAQIERFTWCVETGRPYFASAALTFSPRDYKRYGVLTLPFADADGRVARLLFVFGFGAA